jgi:hypothetical protein
MYNAGPHDNLFWPLPTSPKSRIPISGGGTHRADAITTNEKVINEDGQQMGPTTVLIGPKVLYLAEVKA